MSFDVEVYWSFRSPYSYLAVHRLQEIERTYDARVNMRPVYPLAVRQPNFFEQVNPQWIAYLRIDCPRIAQMAGIPFAWPNPDPIVQDMKTRKIAAEQPYIRRLTRLGAAAVEQGRGLPFIAEVSRLIFGGVAGWNEGDHLQRAAERAGLDLALLDRLITENADRYEEQIAANEAAQRAAGHWGVPLMTFNGEPFFGQDRIDLLLWRMQQSGLQRRS